jgi:hypothetical protein
MGAGFGAGFAVGIAVGAASGRKRVGEALQEYIERQEIIIQTGQGRTLSAEEFLSDALQADTDQNRRMWLIVSFGLGLLLLAGILIFLLLLNF